MMYYQQWKATSIVGQWQMVTNEEIVANIQFSPISL